MDHDSTETNARGGKWIENARKRAVLTLMCRNINKEVKNKTYNPSDRWTEGIMTDIREEREIEQLIDSETLQPICLLEAPDITKVTAASALDNHVLPFSLLDARKQQVDVYLKECALRSKVRLMIHQMRAISPLQSSLKATDAVEEKDGDIGEYVKSALLKHAELVDVSPISQIWLDNIYSVRQNK